jgi:hypothetical protein
MGYELTMLGPAGAAADREESPAEDIVTPQTATSTVRGSHQSAWPGVLREGLRTRPGGHRGETEVGRVSSDREAGWRAVRLPFGTLYAYSRNHTIKFSALNGLRNSMECESRWRSAYRSRKPPRLMCVMRGIPLGVEVTVAVRLSADAGFVPVLRLAARGTVVRTESRPDGCRGLCGRVYAEADSVRAADPFH